MTHTRIVALSISLALTTIAHVAGAQTPAPAPNTSPEPAPASADSAELTRSHQQGLDAFARGDYAEAAALFREVSEKSRQPGRRAMAEEMAKEAERLAAERARMDAGRPRKLTHGHLRMLGGSLLLGLNYGWMLPVGLRLDDREVSFLVGYLLTTATTLAVPYVLTRNTRVGEAEASLAFGGGVLGLLHGGLLYGLVTGDDDFSPLALSMFMGSVTEASLGYVLARRWKLNRGVVQSINFGSLAGSALAFGLHSLVRPNLGDIGKRELTGVLLGGSAAGMVGGFYAAKKRNYSLGDAYIVQSAGLLGAFAGFAPIGIWDIEDSRAIVGMILAGTGLGLFAGDFLMRNLDARPGQGALVGLAAVVGGIVGTGVGSIVTPETNRPEELLPATALGALGGFLTMYLLLDFDDADATAASDRPENATRPQMLGLSPWVGTGASDARGLGLVGRF